MRGQLAYRTFGILYQKRSSITTGRNPATFPIGGLVNRWAGFYLRTLGPSINSCLQMWETAMKAGMLTANLMW